MSNFILILDEELLDVVETLVEREGLGILHDCKSAKITPEASPRNEDLKLLRTLSQKCEWAREGRRPVRKPRPEKEVVA